MNSKLMYTLVAMAIFSSSPAQKQKAKFNSINTGGIIFGQSGTYGLFQSVNGLQYQKWFAGVGTGYDYHYYKSVPLFIDARRYIGKENQVFLYGDIGYNFPQDNKPGREIFSYSSYHFSGGVYTDIGAGYGIKLINTSVLISGGYSYKNIRSRIGAVSPCLVPPCPENFSDYNYGFNRLLLKAGISLR